MHDRLEKSAGIFIATLATPYLIAPVAEKMLRPVETATRGVLLIGGLAQKGRELFQWMHLAALNNQPLNIDMGDGVTTVDLGPSTVAAIALFLAGLYYVWQGGKSGTGGGSQAAQG